MTDTELGAEPEPEPEPEFKPNPRWNEDAKRVLSAFLRSRSHLFAIQEVNYKVPREVTNNPNPKPNTTFDESKLEL